jgi:hypothetical protein
LQDYSSKLENIPHCHKIDQMAVKYLDPMAINHSKILHCKSLQNLPKFGFFVWKYAIWQPRRGYVLWLAIPGANTMTMTFSSIKALSYTLAGFNLTTHRSCLLGGRRRRYHYAAWAYYVWFYKSWQKWL